MSNEKIKIKIAEKDPITVKVGDKDPIKVKVKGLALPQGYLDADTLKNWLKKEVPTKLTASKFQTAYNYTLLSVYLNGQRLGVSDVTELTDDTFEISIDSIITDVVEVEYYKII